MKKDFYVNRKKDDGVAIAMVLFMTLILSLWVISVAYLLKSSSISTKTQIESSNYKSNVVSAGIGQALAALTPNNLNVRYGVHSTNISNGSTTDFPCQNLPSNIATNGVFTSTINPYIKIECVESIESGKTKPLASYILSGTICPTGNSCIVGKDVGLQINNQSANNTCTQTATLNQLSISGGIVNSSGAWNGVSCGTLFLSGSGSNLSRITQPEDSDPNCPALKLSFTSGSGGQTCGCPIVSKEYLDIDACLPGIAADSIDPFSRNEFKGYLDSQASQLLPVSGNVASFSGDCSTSVLWSPGIIGDNEIKKLNEQTGTSGAACGPNNPIVFSPGVYRFKPLNCLKASDCTWSILSDVRIVGGAATSNFTDCSNSSPGVQFQLSFPASLSFKSGYFSLCNSSAPVISAPLLNSPANFSWTGDWRQKPIFELQNSSGKVELNFNGVVYAPAGFADISLNSNAVINFKSGAIFRAVTLTETGSFSSGTSVSPPPPFNGDRIVQLRFFWESGNISGQSGKSAPTGIQNDLGIVQIVIRDYYGRRFGSSYQILSWRIAP